MRILGVIVNIFLPGVGTLLVGKIAEGIVQIILAIFAFILTTTVFLSIIGVPLGIIVWIWALVSAATSKEKPVVIVERQRD